MKKKLTLKKEAIVNLENAAMELFKGGLATMNEGLYCLSADVCWSDAGKLCEALSIANQGGGCNTCGGGGARAAGSCNTCGQNTVGGKNTCFPYDCAPTDGGNSCNFPDGCALPSVGCAQ